MTQTPKPEERAPYAIEQCGFQGKYWITTGPSGNGPLSTRGEAEEHAKALNAAHAQGVLAGQQVERGELDFGSLAQMLHDMPENRPLYKDSGSWQVRSDDMEQVLYQQDANETFHAFIVRCYTAENVYQDAFGDNAPAT